MIGRADIEGSKSDVAMNAWPPQASYPCGSIGPAFAVPTRTERRDQASFCPFAPREVSVHAELALGHLRYSLTDVPPQSNSPPGSVFESDHAGRVSKTPRGNPNRRKDPTDAARSDPVPSLSA
ncbi:conserved hypothetical protein [Pediculus humanus corporis]|uniref:Uncharacterized protein n=1 Tax=Pediculus humanus subsp. corporis TaxID=121224 RepID=E0VP56_PEDHC|nr:uncharacterized protein Phum_PHUM421010 [Pediculus humanus corporis]EEB15162.1 conserved hypothetical protein [Pediculus humanus corporis]EEB16395.1 conserved hypothetical protein [Pediculus humanus corporis]